MKKVLITIAIFVLPLASFGATQIVKSLKSWEYMAQIETTNQGNIFVYKVVDGTTNCYVMSNDFSINSRINGADFGISCVANQAK